MRLLTCLDALVPPPDNFRSMSLVDHLPSLKDAPTANDDHIVQLKNGVDAWNAWRLKNPDTCPDLNHADLGEADLFRADLSGTDLSRANLSETDLRVANLRGQTYAARTSAGRA
jgi:hypothetical protein